MPNLERSIFYFLRLNIAPINLSVRSHKHLKDIIWCRSWAVDQCSVLSVATVTWFDLC